MLTGSDRRVVLLELTRGATLAGEGVRALLGAAGYNVVANAMGEGARLGAGEVPVMAIFIITEDAQLHGLGKRMAETKRRWPAAKLVVMSQALAGLPAVCAWLDSRLGDVTVISPDAPLATIRAILARVLATPATATRPEPELTPRQFQICELLARGYAPRNIAKWLGMSEKTVSSHKLEALQRLQLHRRAEQLLFYRYLLELQGEQHAAVDYYHDRAVA